MAVPRVDERIKYVGPTFLRRINGAGLCEIENPVVIQVDDEPVVVLIPYDQYLLMQTAIKGEEVRDQ